MVQAEGAEGGRSLEWLALLTRLTPDEQARLDFVGLPGAGSPLRIGELVYMVGGARALDRIVRGAAVETASLSRVRGGRLHHREPGQRDVDGPG